MEMVLTYTIYPPTQHYIDPLYRFGTGRYCTHCVCIQHDGKNKTSSTEERKKNMFNMEMVDLKL